MSKGLQIALISVHGLIRGTDPEYGLNPDTGGQVKYVLELTKALSQADAVAEVLLFTRQVLDPHLDSAYGIIEEVLGEKARIIRIPFGPKRFVRKEKLWPYIDSFVDQTLNYFRRHSIVPDIIHGHYSESGYAAAQLGRLLGIPTVFTGHSLGKVKKELLLSQGMTEDKIEEQFHISQRIEAEEFALATASCVIAYTYQEVEEKYSNYQNYHPETMDVIPPGINLDSYHSPGKGPSVSKLIHDIEVFLNKPAKPAILAIARPTENKNFETLLKAYGENHELQELANLVIIAGNREDIRNLPTANKKIMSDILTLIDVYNLYGKVAYPKHHHSDDIPGLYRWAAGRKSIFVNPSIVEPFGVTLLEAGASGLPVVAGDDGGPRDIIGHCENGELVDPLDHEAIAHAIIKILTLPGKWNEYSKAGIAGIERHYTWESHIKRYLRSVEDIIDSEQLHGCDTRISENPEISTFERFIITDIDNTLLGDETSLDEFREYLDALPEYIGFGIATGRNRNDALQVLEEHNIRRPDILIAGVGTGIYFGQNLDADSSWFDRINYQWEAEKVRDLFDDTDGFFHQDEGSENPYKVSYRVDLSIVPGIAWIKKQLREAGMRVKVVLSLGMYLDIIPIRAGDGLAIRHLAFCSGIPWENILVIGDSGNDEAMLKGETLGVVVANYSPELQKLKGWPRIFFASRPFAGGIIEGMHYYHFLEENIEIPNDRIE